MLSGDEVYGDEITSGDDYWIITLDEREQLITDLFNLRAGFTLLRLSVMTDRELLELAEDYDLE